MVQGQYQLAAREDRVLKLVGELYGVVRAGADAELAEHAASQIVGVGFQHFRLLAFGIGHHLAFHVDGPVGTVHLADAASHAMMVVVGGVDHFQTASVQGRDVQVFFPVFGVTFGGLLAEEDLQRRFHPDQQGLQCLEEIGEISPYAIHCLLFSAFCGWRGLGDAPSSLRVKTNRFLQSLPWLHPFGSPLHPYRKGNAGWKPRPCLANFLRNATPILRWLPSPRGSAS